MLTSLRGSAGCYAVYSTAIDRFLLVDSHDLAVLVRAATLFVSKMVTVICVYDGRGGPRLTNDNCLSHAPATRISQAHRHNATVLLLEGPGAIVDKGPPAAALGKDMVARAQRYLAFTVRASYAQLIANAEASIQDTRVVRGMIPPLETLAGAPLSQVEQVTFGELRNRRIEEILFFSETVERAEAELDALLSGGGDKRAQYAATFKQILREPPSPAS